MAMTDEQKEYVQLLREGKPLPAEYIKGYYGLKWPFEGKLQEIYTKWRTLRLRNHPTNEPQAIPAEIELFLRDQHRRPTKWMAAELGMTEDSLLCVLNQIDSIGLIKEEYCAVPSLVKDTIAHELWDALPDLRFKLTMDRNLYCKRLHDALRNSLNVPIEPLYCSTSRKLNDQPLEYARYIDCLTFEPLSFKHQMWLTFRPKQMVLGPDYVSKLFFAQNRENLEEFAPFVEEESFEAYEPQPVSGG